MDLTDCTSGFRAANRSVILAFAHWYPEDYPEPEVILLLHRAGYRIGELARAHAPSPHAGAAASGCCAACFTCMKVTVCLLLDLVREPWPSGKVMWHELIQRLFLVTFGGAPPAAGRSQTAHVRLKERYALLFLLIGLPFVGLAFWPDAVGWMATQLGIQYTTFALICVSVFLFLMVFELLTIVSVQDQKITALAQLVAILMEKQKLAEPEHRPAEVAESSSDTKQLSVGWKPAPQATQQ